jgi:hypothetical protein
MREWRRIFTNTVRADAIGDFAMRYDLDDDDDDYVVRDGEKVRVPVYLMDAMQRTIVDLSYHRPGYRLGDAASKSTHCGDLDALRDAARRERSHYR